MYNREMSPGEKSIINLAYMMERTKQFTIQFTSPGKD